MTGEFIAGALYMCGIIFCYRALCAAGADVVIPTLVLSLFWPLLALTPSDLISK